MDHIFRERLLALEHVRIYSLTDLSNSLTSTLNSLLCILAWKCHLEREKLQFMEKPRVFWKHIVGIPSSWVRQGFHQVSQFSGSFLFGFEFFKKILCSLLILKQSSLWSNIYLLFLGSFSRDLFLVMDFWRLFGWVFSIAPKVACARIVIPD